MFIDNIPNIKQMRHDLSVIDEETDILIKISRQFIDRQWLDAADKLLIYVKERNEEAKQICDDLRAILSGN